MLIGISPVVETGWDEVFQEVKDAGIPLILVDRRARRAGQYVCEAISVPILSKKDAMPPARWLK